MTTPPARPNPLHAALEVVAARDYVADDLGFEPCRSERCDRMDLHRAGACAERHDTAAA